MEAKFGLRIRDSKPSDTGLREHSGPHWCFGGQLSLSLAKEKRSSGPRVGCFKCDGAQLQRHYNASKNAGKQERWQARTLASNRQAKAIKASHGPTVSPQSQEEEKVKKT